MMPISVKVDPHTLSNIQQALIHEGAQELKTTNKYEVFRLQIGGGLVVAYTSGKISITNQEAQEALEEAIKSTERGEPIYEILIGSDEAGKGEWLGPLVVAAVSIPSKSLPKLRSIGVMDSKKLSIKRINELAPQIKKLATTFRIVSVSPKRFNHLFQELKREGGGLNDILAWAHSKAIRLVYSEVPKEKPVMVVIDEFDRIKTANRLGNLAGIGGVTIIQKPYAEEEIPVACASILARAERERWIDNKSRDYRIDLRAISQSAALKMDRSQEFFKTSYLKPRG